MTFDEFFVDFQPIFGRLVWKDERYKRDLPAHDGLMLLDGGQRRRSCCVAADGDGLAAARIDGVDVGDAAAMEVWLQQLGQPTGGAAHRFAVHIATFTERKIVALFLIVISFRFFAFLLIPTRRPYQFRH